MKNVLAIALTAIALSTGAAFAAGENTNESEKGFDVRQPAQAVTVDAGVGASTSTFEATDNLGSFDFMSYPNGR